MSKGRGGIDVPAAHAVFQRRLKAVCKPYHDRLEARLPLLDPHLTRNQYRELIRQFYGFYVPLEAAIQSASRGEMRGEVARRRKTAWLSGDLLALGERPRNP